MSLRSLQRFTSRFGRPTARPRGTLLVAQTSVRLLERLLTLRVARSAYVVALETAEEP